MTTRQLAQRVARLETARRGDDGDMTIPVQLVDASGRVVQVIPAQPIPDLRQPGRRVDYRLALEAEP